MLVPTALHPCAPTALALALENAALGRRNHIRVLSYRRVDDPARFRAQLQQLTAHCHLVGATELLEALAGNQSLPAGAAMLTFDGSHRDFSRHAWPVLRSRRLPAVLFVPTAFPDDPKHMCWSDRLDGALAETTRDQVDTDLGRLDLASPLAVRHAAHQLHSHAAMLPHGDALRLVDRVCQALGPGRPVNQALGWDELRRLSHEGVILAAQSRTHPLLDRVSPARACDEVLGSIDDLRRRTGTCWPLFAYPGGRFTAQVLEVLAAAGVRAAFTADPGINDLGRAAPLQLRRIRVE